MEQNPRRERVDKYVRGKGILDACDERCGRERLGRLRIQKGTMHKLCMLVSVAGLLEVTTAEASFDGAITFARGSFQFGDGGEFTVATSPEAGMKALGTFQTFCLEYTEQVSFGVNYVYRINSGAAEGGRGWNAIDPNTGLHMDNISIGTAYLYSLFRSGNLQDGNWNYYDAASRSANASLLQNAFWFLEEEVDRNNLPVGSLAAGSHLYNILSAGLGGSYADWMADSGGRYGVVALNIFDSHGNRVQDQLGVAPEPSTMIAGALLLGPFLVSALRGIRRKV